MPQTNVLLDWRLTYPIDAPAQKPGGVLVGTVRTPSATTWAANTVTVTVPAVTDPVGTSIWVTLVGYTPAAYNGRFQGTVASATTITFPLTPNPGAVTQLGQISYTSLVSTSVPNAGMVSGPLAVGSAEYQEMWDKAAREKEAKDAAVAMKEEVDSKKEEIEEKVAEEDAEEESTEEEDASEDDEEEEPEEEPPHPSRRKPRRK